MKRIFSILIVLLSCVCLSAQGTYTTSDYVPAVGSNGLWGYKQFGNWVIQPTYSKAMPFSEGYAVVSKLGKYGFINKDGELVIQYHFDDAKAFSEGLAPVKRNSRWGFINQKGEMVLAYMYESAEPFSRGLSSVNRFGSTGYVDKDGNFYRTVQAYFSSFKGFTKYYVEDKVNEWQKKGKYEKTEQWKARVNDESRKKLIAKLVSEATDNFIAEQSKTVKSKATIVEYDADSEVFLLHDNVFGNILVPVPISKAELFEKEFADYTRKNVYCVNGDKLDLAEAHFIKGNNDFKYSNKNKVKFTSVDIDYSFEKVDFNAVPQTTNPLNNNTIEKRRDTAFAKADVDVSIPETSMKKPNTFAVIIANEDYRREEKVDYAKNDGEVFKEYCIKALGLPEKNIRFVSNATFLDMKEEVSWLNKVAGSYNGDANIIFYYAGHGIPDESTRDAYLLPVDGVGSNPATGFKLGTLYDMLSTHPTQSTLVFLDACFSGAQRNGTMMASARGVAIKAHEEAPKGNLVIFTAASGDETAYPYREKGHGLFTYYLLKCLQENNGNMTLGNLADYLKREVKRTSIVENSKTQTPTVSSSLPDAIWKGQKIR